MQMIIFENHELYIEKHESEIPWVKIFTKEPYRELTDVPHELRRKLWEMYDIVEEEMRLYYKPKKINMASFANMLPRVHVHVMARFEHDSHFPNPMWGEQQRQASLNLPDEEKFHEQLFNALNKRFHM